MSRYTATFFHFLISFAVFIVPAYLVIFVWFPGFFFTIDGGWEGLRIMMGVHLVIGPVLTLAVFKSGKPGLRFDLAMIGLFQTVCLAVGSTIIFSERPQFFVYYDQHFYSNSADTYTRFGLPVPDYRAYSDSSPAHVYVKLPDNPIEEADFRRVLYDDNIPLWAYPPTYRPLSEIMAQVVKAGTSEATLRDRDAKNVLDAWLMKHGGTFEDFAFIPIHSRYRDVYLGIHKVTGTMVDIVEIPPPLSLATEPLTQPSGDPQTPLQS